MKNIHYKLFTTFLLITSINSFLLAQSSQPAVLLRCINQDSSIIKLYQDDLICLNNLDFNTRKKLKLSGYHFYTLKGITPDSLYLSYKNKNYNISRENISGFTRINDAEFYKEKGKKESSGQLTSGLILLLLGLILGLSSLSRGYFEITEDTNSGCTALLLAVPMSIIGFILLVNGVTRSDNNDHDKLLKSGTLIKLKDPRWTCSCYKLP
ncbi:MAG: hypothetical protein U0V49_14475 [Saprospiraceae bacterium]